MSVRLRLNDVMERFQKKHNVDFTIRAWSKAIGLSVHFLHQCRHGRIKRLDLEKLGVLCKFFSCTPDDLLWDDEHKDAAK